MTPQQQVCEAMLATGSCFVHLAPSVDGVIVPEFCRGTCPLVLQWGLNMANPIRDLAVDESGIRGWLSFARVPHWCDVPWTAVLAMTDDTGKGVQFNAPPPVPAQPALRLIKGGKS